MMILRVLAKRVQRALEQFPVVCLLGARQVGKTTLARSLAGDYPGHVFLDLERPSDRARLGDPELFLERHASRLVVIDEIQRQPELFPVLRALVDDQRRAGRFLILGSAAPELLRQASESLAGRLVNLELSPLHLGELPGSVKPWRRLWLRGGFPPSYLAASDERSLEWREAFIQTHLERDVPGYGLRVAAPALHRFWQMIAHQHAQTWNASRIATSLQVNYHTAAHYLDILEATFMVRRLQPFAANLKKRLIKAPKVYVRDSGLLHALLGIPNIDELQGNPIIGSSWEGWALEQVLARAPATCRPHYYRTATGVELDLVLEGAGRSGLTAVEFKYASQPQVTKGFHQALEDLKPARAFVVAPVPHSFPLARGIEVLSPHDLEKIFS